MSNNSNEEKISTELLSYENITGNILYHMTNDYMFRAVLQKNKKVLEGLVCSLLRLSPSDIQSLEITNPIELGAAIKDKEFWLDVSVLLNNNIKLNLEMQVANEGNWKDRSLSYLCRSFDSLLEGQDYIEVMPTIHISFLDFTLFPEAPEFYAAYQFQNVKNHRVFSDKLQLRVVELNQINLATEEDKQYELDYWAHLFKVNTWEELKVMAAKNEYFEETAKTLYALGSDARIREECRRRNDYLKQQKYYETTIATQGETIKEQDSIIKEQDTTIKEQDTTIKEQDTTIKEQDITIKEQSATIAAQEARIAELEALVTKE